MKKPLTLSGTWSSSADREPELKKFKRKSREPKRLFTASESDRMRIFPMDMSDVNTADESRMGVHNVSKMAPLQRQLLTPQEVMSGIPGDCMAPGHSGAIDMRIGINVPGVTSRMSQSPLSPLSNHEISHWPTSISQPLSNRLKLGLHPTFPLSTSTSGHLSPGHQEFCAETCLPGQSSASSRVSRSPQSPDQLEVHVSSQKDSPKKQVGMGADARGHLPEVKAVQQTRRLLANARERTRVHTISAAFEALRKQVPCYSYGQKLSKLAILRIACNYILSLAQLAELDYSSDHSSVSFSQCVEQCTRTLQAEGRSKKRKE